MKHRTLLFPILLFCTILFSSASLHDYYFGYSEIMHNKEKQRLEIMVKLFTDDLGNALEKASGNKLNLNTPNESADSDRYIDDYLMKKTSISINGKSKEMIYLGHEYEDDVTFMYLEVPKIKRIKSFEFHNTLLFELFKDQKHLINVNIGGGFKSKTLSRHKKKLKLKNH